VLADAAGVGWRDGTKARCRWSVSWPCRACERPGTRASGRRRRTQPSTCSRSRSHRWHARRRRPGPSTYSWTPADEKRLNDALVGRGAKPVTPRPERRAHRSRHRCLGRRQDEDTIPLEAGIEDRAISFTKGLLRRAGSDRPRARPRTGSCSPSAGGPCCAGWRRPTCRLSRRRARAGDKAVARSRAGLLTAARANDRLGYVQSRSAAPGTRLDALHDARRVVARCRAHALPERRRRGVVAMTRQRIVVTAADRRAGRYPSW